MVMIRWFFAVVLLAFAGMALASGPKRPNKQGVTWLQGIPWRGPVAQVETVADMMLRQKLNPTIPEQGEEEEPVVDRSMLQNPDSPRLPQWPPPPKLPPSGSTGPAFAPGLSWLAIDEKTAGNWVPPDNMLAAGPTQILVNVNDYLRIFSKTGVKGPLDISAINFWAKATPNLVSDPQVRFDSLTNRWFIIGMDFVPTTHAPNNIVVAVSDGPTITGTTKFSLFSFMPQNVGPTPNADTGLFADRPSLGIDRNALYIGVNMFKSDATFQNTSLYVVRKSSVLGAGPIVVTASVRLSTPRRRECSCPAEQTTPIPPP